MKSKSLFFIFTVFLLMVFSQNGLAQDSTKTKGNKPGHGLHFVDLDGDGYNDNAPDHDGDGIPNGLDPDWQKLHSKQGKGKKLKKRHFVDLDGDGINDYLQTGDGKQNVKEAKAHSDTGSPMDGNTQKGKGPRKGKHGGNH